MGAIQELLNDVATFTSSAGDGGVCKLYMYAHVNVSQSTKSRIPHHPFFVCIERILF